MNNCDKSDWNYFSTGGMDVNCSISDDGSEDTEWLDCMCSDCENSLQENLHCYGSNYCEIHSSINNSSMKLNQFSKLNDKFKKVCKSVQKRFNVFRKKTEDDANSINASNLVEIPQELYKTELQNGNTNQLFIEVDYDKNVAENISKIETKYLPDVKAEDNENKEAVKSTYMDSVEHSAPSKRPNSTNVNLQNMKPCTSASVTKCQQKLDVETDSLLKPPDSTQVLIEKICRNNNMDKNISNWIAQQLSNKSNLGAMKAEDLMNSRRMKTLDLIKRINENQLPSEHSILPGNQNLGLELNDSLAKLFDDHHIENKSSLNAYCEVVEIDDCFEDNINDKPVLQICSAAFENKETCSFSDKKNDAKSITTDKINVKLNENVADQIYPEKKFEPNSDNENLQFENKESTEKNRNSVKFNKTLWEINLSNSAMDRITEITNTSVTNYSKSGKLREKNIRTPAKKGKTDGSTRSTSERSSKKRSSGKSSLSRKRKSSRRQDTRKSNLQSPLTNVRENKVISKVNIEEINKDKFCQNVMTEDEELNDKPRGHSVKDRDVHLDLVHTLRTTTGGAMHGSSRVQEIFLKEANNNLSLEMVKEKLRTVKEIGPFKNKEDVDLPLNDDHVDPDDPYIYRLSQEQAAPSNTEECFKIQETIRRIMDQPFSMGKTLSNAPVNTTNQRYVETSTVQLEPGVESGTSKPSPSDKFRFYWVPQNYREFLQTADHPIASDYFPQDTGPPDYRRKYDGVDTNKRNGKNGRARFCGVLIREFFHVNLYLRMHPETGNDCYVLYNVVLWGRESQPVAHYKTPVPVPFLPGSAHHIASLSDSAVHDLLNQNYMTIVFYLTYFPRWNKPSDPKPELWFLSNPPGTKELGISGGNAREFENLLKKNNLTDIDLIVCGNVELPAHRAILCSQSPVIHSLIKDAKTKAKIKLPGFDSVLSARQFIYFLYTGNLGPEDMDWYDRFKETDPEIEKRKLKLLEPVPRWVQILEQLAAGIRYQVPGLVRKSSAWLASELSIENCSVVYTVAHKFQVDHLKRAASNFIKKNLNKVKSTRGWDELKVYGAAVCELLNEEKQKKPKITQPPARIGDSIYLSALHDLTAFSHIPLLHHLRRNACCRTQPPLASKCGLGMWRDYGKWAASVPQNPEEMDFLLETTGEIGIPKLGTREFMQEGIVKLCEKCKLNGCFPFETDENDEHPTCHECKNEWNTSVKKF